MKNQLLTNRLVMRRVSVKDADFMLELFNSPTWLMNIGDRNVHTLEEAENYIENGPLPFYEKHGFGSYCLQLNDSSTRIGMCGLYKRDNLVYYDLGFALLPEFEGKGYGYEACLAVIEQSKQVLELDRLLAITSKTNHRSIQLLERVGFQLIGDYFYENDSNALNCFQLNL